MIKHILMAGALVAAMITGAANATPLEIQLQSGGQTLSMTGSTPGLVYTQAIGNFTFASNTATSLGGHSLDLSSIEIDSGSTGGTLVITASASQLTGAPVSAWLSQFSGNFVSGSANVSFQTYIDYSDTLLGTGTLLSSFTDSSTPFSMASYANAVLPTGPYALTEVLTINATGNSQLSFDGSVGVPEPSSLLILASGLIGAGLIRRRRRSV